MKKKLILLLLTAFFSYGIASNSQANFIILSGDSNITDVLIGSAAVAGNQQFFSNVLGTGTTVAVLNQIGLTDISTAAADDKIHEYYSSLSGVSSALIDSLTPEILSGVDLFVSVTPDSAFTSDELTALDAFYNSGGSIFFIGEHSTWRLTSNFYINSALTYLGSGMSIVEFTTWDPGVQTATGSQIATDDLTTDVENFQYAGFGEIAGGTKLFHGYSGENYVLVAYEMGDATSPPAFLLPSLQLLLLDE